MIEKTFSLSRCMGEMEGWWVREYYPKINWVWLYGALGLAIPQRIVASVKLGHEQGRPVWEYQHPLPQPFTTKEEAQSCMDKLQAAYAAEMAEVSQESAEL